ncbi:hypothetical protein J7J69_05575 [candidate division WOR-3 bacterium]|nr:hypothetical protein [candidate division WOR-3 bacterium]
MKKMWLVGLLVVTLGTSSLKASGKFSGDMIGEYYYVSQNHNDSLVGHNGFWFRRIYFTYDNFPQENVKIRLRLEMGSPGKFNTKSTLNPVVKDAFISFNGDAGKLTFGIQPTPTFAKVEDSWGYRSLEKTPLDLQKWSSSRDFGISFTGRRSILDYKLMIGNSSSNKSECNKGKRVYGALGVTPIDGLYIEFYGDYSGIYSSNKDYIVQGFASYRCSLFRIGMLYAVKGEIGNSQKRNILSGYGVFNTGEKLDVIVRCDRMFEANPEGEAISYIPFAQNSPSTFILVGLSYEIYKNIKIIPNVEYVIYDSSAVSPDMYPRLTLYYKW